VPDEINLSRKGNRRNFVPVRVKDLNKLFILIFADCTEINGKYNLNIYGLE
jgi:hypothetical protein